MPIVKTRNAVPATKKRRLNEKSSAATKPALSAKFVGESDGSDDDDVPASSKHSTPSRKKLEESKTSESLKDQSPIRRLSSSRSLSDSDQSDEESENTNDAASRESSSDTDASTQLIPSKLSSEQQQSSNKATAKRKSNGTVSNNIASTAQKSKAKEKSESSDSSRESESDVESSSSEGEGPQGQTAGQESSDQDADLSRPRVPFEPPADFVLASHDTEPTGSNVALLGEQNLRGKQIWQVTAPEAAPFESVRRALIAALRGNSPGEGDRQLTYTVVPELEDRSHSATVLMPLQSGQYQALHHETSKIFNIRRRMILPSHLLEATGSDPNSSTDLPDAQTSRISQPRDLKMRYHAFGLPSDTDSDIPTRESQLSPLPRPSSRPAEKGHKQKRKRSDLKDQSPLAEPSPSKKKQKMAEKFESALPTQPQESSHENVNNGVQKSLGAMKQARESNDDGNSRRAEKMAWKRNKREGGEHQNLEIGKGSSIRISPTASLKPPSRSAEVVTNGAFSASEKHKSHRKMELVPPNSKPSPAAQRKHLNDRTSPTVRGEAPSKMAHAFSDHLGPATIPMPETPLDPPDSRSRQSKSHAKAQTAPLSPDPASILLPETPLNNHHTLKKKRRHRAEDNALPVTPDVTSSPVSHKPTLSLAEFSAKLSAQEQMSMTPNGKAQNASPDGRANNPSITPVPVSKAKSVERKVSQSLETPEAKAERRNRREEKKRSNLNQT